MLFGGCMKNKLSPLHILIGATVWFFVLLGVLSLCGYQNTANDIGNLIASLCGHLFAWAFILVFPLMIVYYIIILLRHPHH